MGRDEAILDAVRRLYGAALAPDEWPQALPSIISAVGGHAIMLSDLHLGTRSVDFTINSGVEPTTLAGVVPAVEAGLFDRWINALLPDRALRSSAIVPDGEFVRSEFYNLGVRPTGTFYAATAAAQYGAHRSGFVSVARRLGSPDYDAADMAALQVLVPHLAAALKVRARLGEARLHAANAYAVLDRLDAGVILVDAQARAHFLNTRAAALVSEADGLSVTSGRLAAARPDETRRLRRAIAFVAGLSAKLSLSDTADAIVRSATEAAASRLLLSRPSLRPPLVVSVVPLGRGGLKGDCGSELQVAVFVAEPDGPVDISTSALAALFELTPREAAIAVRLAQGADLAEIARELGIGLGTVRNHLKRVFDKTGTNRQSHLVRLILRGLGTPRR